MRKLPPWIRMELKTDEKFVDVSRILREQDLTTVCRSANCPNVHGCWNDGTATFMIMGDTCTRNCTFCGIHRGKPSPLSQDEPERIASAVEKMKLNYVVLTSVTRDDLSDGGASHFAAVIENIKSLENPPRVEVLTPDFQGNEEALDLVAAATPDVFNHNIETVKRLQAPIRPQASYACSLSALKYMADKQTMKIKSGLLVGLGETDDEILETIHDLAQQGCEMLTIGQYLTPSQQYMPVQRYVSPDVFELYKEKALACGMKAVASAPLVRSSFQADQLLAELGE